MKIAGIAIVRDVADVIALNLLHHFGCGIDAMYVVDHASIDGTDTILARAAQRFPVRWVRYDGAFMQRDITTELARLAHREGADWIVPIDSDEFWWSESGDLRRALSSCHAAAIESEVVNFIQRHEVIRKTPRGLLTMTRRVAEPTGTLTDAHRLVASHRAAFVEVPFPSKWICRASATIDILSGAHVVDGLRGTRIASDSIKVLHAPLRARSVFDGRVAHGTRIAAIEADPEIAWQSRWWGQAASEGILDAEWAANSYDDDGMLHVGREVRPLVVDFRLRDCVAKWIDDDLVTGDVANEVFAGSPASSRRSEDEGGGVATLVRPATAVDVEMLEIVRVAEVRGLRRHLDAALNAVAARDKIIARITSSVPGRIYRRLAGSKMLRMFMRRMSGLR